LLLGVYLFFVYTGRISLVDIISAGHLVQLGSVALVWLYAVEIRSIRRQVLPLLSYSKVRGFYTPTGSYIKKRIKGGNPWSFSYTLPQSVR